jgi:asparagine N-glycosylation enzyme membrane subunit Stt3
VEPELILRALSYGLVVLLAITLLVLSLISIRKENRRGEPIGGMIWFSLVMIGFCVVIVLLAGYAQKARSIERVTHRVEAVTFGLNEDEGHGS